MITEHTIKGKNFSFKSKTNEGFAARINVIYMENILQITKTFISKRGITAPHIRLIKPFKTFSIYQEKISLKEKSFFAICAQILKYNQL